MLVGRGECVLSRVALHLNINRVYVVGEIVDLAYDLISCIVTPRTSPLPPSPLHYSYFSNGGEEEGWGGYKGDRGRGREGGDGCMICYSHKLVLVVKTNKLCSNLFP